MPVTAPADALHIAHHARATRFEALDGGRRVGVLEYQLRGAAAVFTHTQVEHDEPVERVTTPLIAAAFDLLCARGYYVVALCPHVRAFLAAHPGYLPVADTRFLDGPRPAPMPSVS